MRDSRPPWPVIRQLECDPLALGAAAQSDANREWQARIKDVKAVKSVCPYCAVGCGQLLYVKDNKLIQVEGDPDSPISRGRLCPKGAATRTMVQSPTREYKVKYRRPYGTRWEELSLDQAMDMIADRVLKTRRETWVSQEEGKDVNRCEGIASLGGATLDNEENYLMKKLYTALGVVQVENQARI
jgi:formate dehydrogenase major subunit